MQDWLKQRNRVYWYDQYVLNTQESGFARYDPDRIARELDATGAEVVALYAANQQGIAYYPSAVWPQHPNLAGRDYVGDLVERLRRRGRRILIYINWLDSKHPEWQTVPLAREANAAARAPRPLVPWADPSRPHGRVQDMGCDWQLACCNSPHREDIVAVTREIAERYHPDLFHLDMLMYSDVCVCPFCRPHLERICGTREITRESIRAHWADYVDWFGECTASVVGAVSTVLREHGVLAAHNAFVPLYLSPVSGLGARWLPHLDVFVSECFDAFRAPHTDLNTTSIQVRWQHAVGKPAWMLRTGHPMHTVHWPITRAQWDVYAAACKANGAHVFGPCGVGAWPDTRSARPLLAASTQGMATFMKDADLADGAESAADVALVFSWANRDYYGDHARWLEEFTGWARFLIEEHIPFDIVEAEQLTAPADLARYRLVILPNIAHVTDAFCDVVRGAVAAGRRVLATAETSLRQPRAGRRADFALGDVLGVSHRAGEAEGPLAFAWKGSFAPAHGFFQTVVAQGRVLSRRASTDPAGSVASAWDPMPIDATDAPAAARHAFGRGAAAYVAFDLGRYYERHGEEHIGRFMASLVDGLLPRRALRVEAPRTVEVTLWRQPAHGRTVIHLANRTVPWTLPTNSRQITEILPVHDIVVELPWRGPKPRVACRGARIAAEVAGGRLRIRVRRLEDYAAVTITPR